MYDFIIIGSGIAGLTAALEGAKKGTVLIITKKKLQDSNTNLAQGGIAAVFSKSDNFKKHILDTISAGQHHNDKKIVAMVVREAPRTIRKLEALGVAFKRDRKGQLELHLEGGHSKKRIVNAGDTTGRVIQAALIEQVLRKKRIAVLENGFVKDLLVKNKTCYGVSVFHKKSIVQFFARRTVLASGGGGQLFKKTTNPAVATGDGIALAIRAGCKTKDLEFIQFHPTALDDTSSPLFLLSETLRGEGARLVNAKGEYFMKKIHPQADLAPRDIVSRAIYAEQKKGKVFLDLRTIPAQVLTTKYPGIWKTLRAKGWDPVKKPVPVTPAAHYLCGGAIANHKGETNLKNLYAIGEVACTGLHGANRLASNSLLEGAVMGLKVAAKKLPTKILYPKFPQTEYQSQKPQLLIKKSIQKLMWENLGIIRHKKGLEQALAKLKKISARLPSPGSAEIQELHNMVETAVAISKAALKRKKSLGTHFRES